MDTPFPSSGSVDAAYDPALDEMVDVMNLSSRWTGVAGTIFISTRMAAHGPRIKWWPGRPERDGPCLVVTLEDPPRAINLGLPPLEARSGAAGAIAWATLNRAALLRFWEDGVEWLEEEVEAFKRSLDKVP